MMKESPVPENEPPPGARAPRRRRSGEWRERVDLAKARSWIRVWWFIAAGLFAAGVLMGCVWTYEFIRARASPGWPEAAGRITKSETRPVYDESSEYVVWILYRYEAAGRERRGHRVSFREGSTGDYSEEEARALVERYPRGARVTARWDPGDPDFAVREPGVPTKMYWEILIWGLLIAASIALAIWLLYVRSLGAEGLGSLRTAVRALRALQRSWLLARVFGVSGVVRTNSEENEDEEEDVSRRYRERRELQERMKQSRRGRRRKRRPRREDGAAAAEEGDSRARE